MSETLTAWDVYWVMQADRVVDTFTGLAAICTLACVILFAMSVFSLDRTMATEASTKKLKRLCLILAIPSAMFLTLVTFIPNTKSAAAIIVLPAIANNEAIHGEAKELYQLAKEALKDMVRADDDFSDEGS